MENQNFKIDFVGIGAMKAATTWIYECLQEHPQIQLAPKDRTKSAFFLRQQLSENELREYYAFFNCKKGVLKGDFHVGYLTRTEVSDRIRKHNPDAKIIVCLRNPAHRAWSEYNYLRFARYKNWKSFREAIKQRPEIIDHSFYHRYLRGFFEKFPRKNILVLLYEDIAGDELGFIQRIYSFLGVDDRFIPPSVDIRINLTKFKLSRLGGLIHKGIWGPLLKNTKWAWRLKRGGFLKKELGILSRIYMRKQSITNLDREKDDIYEYLKRVYIKDIQDLENLIQRDLDIWKK